MRLPCLLASALLATGCGVPDVTFIDAGSRDATRDSPGDGPAEAEAAADAEGDASTDAADSGDAGTDAPVYCTPDAGPPVGYTCCIGNGGIVCSGNCQNAQACLKCGICLWPNRCCASGSNGNCAAPDAAGGC
jgi:hypothetical protein